MLGLILTALLFLSGSVYSDTPPAIFTFFIYKNKEKDKNKSKYLLIRCNKSSFYFDLQKDQGLSLDDSVCIPVIIRSADNKDITEFSLNSASAPNFDALSNEIHVLCTMFLLNDSNTFNLSCYPHLKSALSIYLNTLGNYEVRLLNEQCQFHDNKQTNKEVTKTPVIPPGESKVDQPIANNVKPSPQEIQQASPNQIDAKSIHLMPMNVAKQQPELKLFQLPGVPNNSQDKKSLSPIPMKLF